MNQQQHNFIHNIYNQLVTLLLDIKHTQLNRNELDPENMFLIDTMSKVFPIIESIYGNNGKSIHALLNKYKGVEDIDITVKYLNSSSDDDKKEHKQQQEETNSNKHTTDDKFYATQSDNGDNSNTPYEPEPHPTFNIVEISKTKLTEYCSNATCWYDLELD